MSVDVAEERQMIIARFDPEEQGYCLKLLEQIEQLQAENRQLHEAKEVLETNRDVGDQEYRDLQAENTELKKLVKDRSDSVIAIKQFALATKITQLQTENEQLKKAVEGLLPLARCDSQEHSAIISFAGELL